MNLDFPSSPVVGQEYRTNGITYFWDGFSWKLKPDHVTQAQTAAFVRREDRSAP